MNIDSRLYDDINLNDCQNRVNDIIKYDDFYIISGNKDLRRMIFLLDKIERMKKIIEELE